MATAKRIHVVINPAAGQDEPILSTLNSVFRAHDVDWDVSITRTFGDATRFARQAAEAGFEIVAGYGGDGTQHEIANGVLGTSAVMGVLPGGTGNNFAKELGTPQTLRPAVELLCTGGTVRHVDVVQVEDEVFILRLYAGVEPEQQTTREDKDRFGKFAYLVDVFRKARDTTDADYEITIDGTPLSTRATVLYVVNAPTNGIGINIAGSASSVDDGLMDAFILSKDDLHTLAGFSERVLNLDTRSASRYLRQGKEMRIDAEPPQAVWADGELVGRTPVSLRVLPRALAVLVP